MKTHYGSIQMSRDPLAILMSREAKSCKGCMYQYSESVFGQVVTVCTKVLPDGKPHKHGKRCKDYREA